jgi:large subunit ribosomal protein L19
MNAIAYVHEQLTGKKDIPDFKPGDNITVNYKIIEGNKERINLLRAMLLNGREQAQRPLLQFVK